MSLRRTTGSGARGARPLGCDPDRETARRACARRRHPHPPSPAGPSSPEPGLPPSPSPTVSPAAHVQISATNLPEGLGLVSGSPLEPVELAGVVPHDPGLRLRT